MVGIELPFPHGSEAGCIAVHLSPLLESFPMRNPTLWFSRFAAIKNSSVECARHAIAIADGSQHGSFGPSSAELAHGEG